MIGPLVAQRTSLFRRGSDYSGRHCCPPAAAAAARVEDLASGYADPGWIFDSMTEPPAEEVRQRYLAWLTFFDVV
jgi:hypothetical protein